MLEYATQEKKKKKIKVSNGALAQQTAQSRRCGAGWRQREDSRDLQTRPACCKSHLKKKSPTANRPPFMPMLMPCPPCSLAAAHRTMHNKLSRVLGASMFDYASRCLWGLDALPSPVASVVLSHLICCSARPLLKTRFGRPPARC